MRRGARLFLDLLQGFFHGVRRGQVGVHVDISAYCRVLGGPDGGDTFLDPLDKLFFDRLLRVVVRDRCDIGVAGFLICGFDVRAQTVQTVGFQLIQRPAFLQTVFVHNI